MNNYEINNIFNDIKILIFTDFNKSKNTTYNNLIPLNANNNNEFKKNKEYCNLCCTIC